MKVIVTRPVADAASLARQLQAHGHDCIFIPLLEIVPRKNVTIARRSYQAICLTSANGLSGDWDWTPYRDVPVLCVGPQSAAAAVAKGFTNVTHGGGDVDGLVHQIASTRLPEAGPLLYVSGAQTSGDLEGRLRARNFSVDRVITYDAVPVMPSNLGEKLNDADAVLLYSPRTARLWIDAILDQGLETSARRLLHVCLSANVASRLPESWITRIAKTPDENAVLACLE